MLNKSNFSEEEVAWFNNLTKDELQNLLSINYHGWPAYYDKIGEDDDIKYKDNNKSVYSESRPCKLCKKKFKDDYDPCIGKLPGVEAACCGHGAKEGYILFTNGKRMTTKKLDKDELKMINFKKL